MILGLMLFIGMGLSIVMAWESCPEHQTGQLSKCFTTQWQHPMIIVASLCFSPERSLHVKWTEQMSTDLLNQQNPTPLWRGMELTKCWEVIERVPGKQMFWGSPGSFGVFFTKWCLINWEAPFLLTWCLSKRRSSRWPRSGLNTKPAPISSCQFPQYL